MSPDKNIPKRQWGKSEIVGGRQAFRLEMILRELKKRVPSGSQVLDAGCGVGTLTTMLIMQGYQVGAVDAAPLCIEKLQQKVESLFTSDAQNAQSFFPHGPGRVSGLDSLPFEDQSFDAIVSGEVLEHLEDDQAAVKEFSRVLRPGGFVIVTVPANPRLWSVDDDWAGHKRRYRACELRSLFEDRGFSTSDLHFWGWPVTYLYNRLVFQPWLKRKLAQGDPDFSPGGSESSNAILFKLMAMVFNFDRLFFRLPWGIGLVGVFKKTD